MDRARIAELVRSGIGDFNEGRAPDQKLAISEETPIVAADSAMDSLAFISFSADLEARLRDELEGELPQGVADLWSDDSALFNVGTLTDRLAALLGG